MELKVAEDKSWMKREYLRTSTRGRNQKTGVTRSNILDAIARVNKGTGEIVCETDELSGGAVRMKIRVKKEDLKQVLEAMRDDGKSINYINHRHQYSSSPAASLSSSSLEQRLILLRKRQLMRTAQIRIRQRGSAWTPALQSIPEEL